MNRIDEIFTEEPTFGKRRIRVTLEKQYNISIGLALTRSLMQKMGLYAVYPKPKTTIPDSQHQKYPYLLRNVKISSVNQVWSTDITYIRLKNGFAFLTAIIDWYSRRILAWKLSNTLSSDFCIEVLKEAVNKYGWPEIFNTDQGCQYTSERFTKEFEKADCTAKLSMDGKGRSLDNVYIERFWRTIKYEDIYIKGYENMVDCEKGIACYIKKYNDKRIHSSLDNKTPSDVYFNRVTSNKVA